MDGALAPALNTAATVTGIAGVTHDGMQPINERSPLF